VAIGESSWTSLTVGGGFTIACGTGDVLVENSNYYPFLAGYNAAIVHVPPTDPADYDVNAFNGVAQGQCRFCSFQYRGRVLEGQAGINAGTHGVGFSFNVGGVEITRVDQKSFWVCRPDRPPGTGGCYP
jgi:hypothetical protein